MGNEEKYDVEAETLQRIEGKIDTLTEGMGNIERRAAITGGLCGGIAGGLVTVGILFIKVKLGG